MKKVAALSLTLLAAMTLAACGSSATNDSSNNSANSSKKAEPKDAITMSKYNSIKVGTISDGAGGSAEKTVKAMYGKPASETEATLPGTNKTSKNYTWTNVGSSLQGASVTAQFINGKTVAKAYTNLSKSKKISDSDYKSVKTGASFSVVKKQLGTPSGESITGSTGITSAQLLIYTNINESKSLTFTFSDNKLMSKSTTSLN